MIKYCVLCLTIMFNSNLNECFKIKRFENQTLYGNEFDFDEIKESSNQKYYYERPVINLSMLMRQNQLPKINELNSRVKNRVNKIPVKCPSCACGKNRNKRIVGGTQAAINEFPFQVALIYKNRFYCGGTLINDLYILTAAHCTYGIKITNIKCIFLVNNLTNLSKSFTRGVNKIWRAKGFNISTFSHDLSIMKLDKRVPITSTSILNPVCLPKVTYNFSDKLAVLIGWGRTNETEPISKILRKVQIPILSRTECEKTGSGNVLQTDEVCAGVGGKNVCFGDSGGPLLVYKNKRYTEIGIVSHGYGCAVPNYPGIFLKVSKYIPYIMKIASRDACFCNA